jgi:hypothetical protein
VKKCSIAARVIAGSASTLSIPVYSVCSLSCGTQMIFSSCPASSSISSTPIGRARTTAPGTTGAGSSTIASAGSPSSASVPGMNPYAAG